MQRIAAPMIGGMVTFTLLTLVIIPVLYYLWRSREIATIDRLPRRQHETVDNESASRAA